MEIHLNHIGKRYASQWILKNVNWELTKYKKYAILGSNGSGKSTLLQIISGFISPTEGQITWNARSKTIERDSIYKYISLCTPASQLHNEWTVAENIEFHQRFKVIQKPLKEILHTAMLVHHGDKKFRHLSSGMQQRLKLTLACLTQCDLLLLDEPCSHLDFQGIEWYKELLRHSAENKTLVIASNSNKDEIFLCEENYTIESPQTNDGGAS